MHVTEQVHLIPGVMANPYLIVEPEGLTLIDSGMRRSENKILRYIADLGRAPDDLRRILITHADGDHVGGLAALQAASGARTYAGTVEAASIANGQMSRPLKLKGLQKALYALSAPLLRAKPAIVHEELADGQELPVLGGLRVVSTPGHTPGHLSFYIPAAGVLFSGDSMRVERGTLRPSYGVNTWDEARAREAFRLQAALGAQIVCPGHGPVVTDAADHFEDLA